LVVGTVEKASDFDRGFQPASGRDRQRWELLDLAERHGAVMPAIEVLTRLPATRLPR
jgi:hypothetical protein